MTFAEREQIFAKDILSLQDIQKLLGFTYPQASAFVNTVKRAFAFNDKPLRIDMKGRLHTQDYLDYFNIKGDNLRYAQKQRCQQ